MTARLVEGYEPDFDIDLRHGKAGERHVLSVIEGLQNGTVEVKNDRLAHRTGNVWIEHACRRVDGWHDSGIATSRADYWALVIGGVVVLVLPTEIVRFVHDKALAEPSLLSEESDGSHPTKGVRVPLPTLFVWVRMAIVRGIGRAA